MLQWFSDNLGTILISLGLLAVVALIIRSQIRQKKRGKSSCGCNCARALAGKCHGGNK
ncbi:MAG: FeoB-associated Cys-rich membrane protein [Eubacteriales bacterium]|nr:FeoB-associated Cys-rich membrane protein [Eubacteriales bacterium]